MKKILLFAFTLLVISGCRKDEATYDGVSIDELYSDFTLLENFRIDKDSIDFGSGEKATFTAKFNKPVNWTIEIRGLVSKAKK